MGLAIARTHDAYQSFLERKRMVDPATGLNDVGELPSFLFSHQRDIVSWALRRGRAAIFAGTGLGKTAMELVWGDKVAAHTGKPVLIFAPLAVSAQHIREAEKFGIASRLVKTAEDVGPGINVTNYQKIDHFDLTTLGGVILDESSILKSTDGHYRTRLIQECATVPFRLAATATPAPNDFTELGNHAEFIGVMSQTGMLATFFVHDGGETQKWRMKGHAEKAFWEWMASWCVMMRKPSDLGYDNAGYDLPPIFQHQHTAGAAYAPNVETGLLFPMEASSLSERIAARRGSVADRVTMAVSIVPYDRPCIIWCNLNSEQDELEKAFEGRCVSVRGSNSDDENERRILAFINGEKPIIIAKPVMLGFGLNLQFCADMVFVGLTDSFEQVYQAIRRCWRFGQKNAVNVHFIASELEGAVVANLKRKEAEAERMADGLVAHMADLCAVNIQGSVRDVSTYNPSLRMETPQWLS